MLSGQGGTVHHHHTDDGIIPANGSDTFLTFQFGVAVIINGSGNILLRIGPVRITTENEVGGRSAAAKEGQGSSKQADKEKRPRERKREDAAVEVPTDVLHPELYNRLVAWRNAEASALGLPVYTVIQQKAILGISNLLPSDKAMLVRIPYFGKKGVEKYGDVILEMVRVYRKEKGLAEPELL